MATLEDYWKADIEIETTTGKREFAKSFFFGPFDTVSLGLGAGASHVTSCGKFRLARRSDRVLVTGLVSHVWTDEGYNFNKGAFFHDQAQILERHGKAKPFKWWAAWQDAVEGELEVVAKALSWRHYHLRPLT